MVGLYLKDTSGTPVRVEIVEVLNTTQVVVDVRNTTPDFAPASTTTLHGTGLSAPTEFDFVPATTTAPPTGSDVLVGPTVKTVTLTVGTRTVAQIVADVEAEVSAADPLLRGGDLNWHVRAEAVAGNPSRLSLVPRSKDNPQLSLSDSFPKVDITGSGITTTIGQSAHKPLGYRLGQTLVGAFDTKDYLSPELLAELTNDAVAGAVAEVVETEVASGTTMSVIINDKKVRDVGVDFEALGVVAGDIIVLSGAQAVGEFVLLTVSGADLEVDKTNDFDFAEQNVIYSIVRRNVRVSSSSTGFGTSVEAVSGPTEFGFPSGEQKGTIPQFEAVDKNGNLLDFSEAKVGDLLKVPRSEEVAISAVDGAEISLETGLLSDLENSRFTIRTPESVNFEQTTERLSEVLNTSLAVHNYDESLDELDAALTSAVLPGQNFAASRNRAKQFTADLVAALTSTPLRTDEYTAVIVPSAEPLADALADFAARSEPAVDSLLDAFSERKYDRAIDLLKRGDFAEFYQTDDETGSFSGAVLSSSRKVVLDLPSESGAQRDVDNALNLASGSAVVPDADEEFDDTVEDSDVGL
jgi:hypothetical protein